jgi:hypothetical protein
MSNSQLVVKALQAVRRRKRSCSKGDLAAEIIAQGAINGVKISLDQAIGMVDAALAEGVIFQSGNDLTDVPPEPEPEPDQQQSTPSGSRFKP